MQDYSRRDLFDLHQALTIIKYNDRSARAMLRAMLSDLDEFHRTKRWRWLRPSQHRESLRVLLNGYRIIRGQLMSSMLSIECQEHIMIGLTRVEREANLSDKIKNERCDQES